MPQYKELRCPECDGTGFLFTGGQDNEECYYCFGTGYVTDADTESSMYSYEKDW